MTLKQRSVSRSRARINNPCLVAIIERFRYQLFAQSVSVRVSRIEQGDTEIECLTMPSREFWKGRPSGLARISAGTVWISVLALK
jgi:hypothetical protein